MKRTVLSVGEKMRKRGSIKFFLADAHNCLMSDGRLIKLIVALIVVGVFCASTLYLSNACRYIYDNGLFPMSDAALKCFTLCMRCVIMFFGFFVAFCCLCGTYAMATEAANRRECSLDTLLVLLHGESLPAAFALYLRTLLCLCICLLPSLAVKKLLTQSTAVFVVLLVLGVLFFAASLFYLLPMASVWHAEGKISCKKAIKASKKAMRGHIFSCFVLTLCLIPIIIISMLSFGIFLIIYTAPLAVVAYAVLGSYAYDVGMRERKEDKDGK